AREADAAAESRIEKCVCFDARIVIEDSLDAEFESVALVENRFARLHHEVFDSSRVTEDDLRVFELDGLRPGSLFGVCRVCRTETCLRIDIELHAESRADREIVRAADEAGVI